MTKQQICWRISRRCSFRRVQCELTHRQQDIPVRLPGSDKTPQNLFNRLVHTFALTVRLRMVGGTHS